MDGKPTDFSRSDLLFVLSQRIESMPSLICCEIAVRFYPVVSPVSAEQRGQLSEKVLKRVCLTSAGG